MSKEKTNKSRCRKSTNNLHTFVIIKGSANPKGTPTWECIHCNKRVKSN